jgi:DNA-binding HxlR family transcriptional regulator
MRMPSPRRGSSRDSVFGTIDAVGDAWSWLILREAILYDVRRFNEFRARLGIARATLQARLGQLTRRGLLVVRPRSEGAPTPEYVLSECGRDFFVCLATAMRWGERWGGGARARLAKATHVSCGARFEAVLVCSECDDPVEARAVDVTLAPGARAGLRRADAEDPGRRREPGLQLLERQRACPIARALRVLGDRWSGLVIREAFLRTRRFDDFQKNLGIAPNILSDRLGRLVELGVLARQPYRDRPLRHEYRLTKKGLDLYPVPLAMLTWGDRWLAGGKPELLLSHRVCGRRFTAVLACGRCGGPVERGDIVFAPPRVGLKGAA